MIDTFYRIKTLHNLGIHIHLHCFEYGRKASKELESFCESIIYYPRSSGFIHNLSFLPYVVNTRRSKNILKNLLQNDYPIFFDGLHTTKYLDHPSLVERKKFIRAHNIEHLYYRNLSHYEPNIVKKLYFRLESFKLKLYEKILHRADCVFAISDREQEYFNNEYHNSAFLAPFHPFDKAEYLSEFGDYILYHGDLSVNENIAVIDSLIRGVFSKVSYPCIIAGKNPQKNILNEALRYSNIKIVSNPDDNEMKELIFNAHVQVLTGLASNGFKLKLLIALHAGRHCIVNQAVVEGTKLSSLCHLTTSNKEITEKIHQLMKIRFTEAMFLKRTKMLSEDFNNKTNGVKLINLIY